MEDQEISDVKQKGVHQEHESDNPKRRSSFLQGTLNAVSALLGISFLITPYTLEQGGWLGLGILILFAAVCCYTAYILGHCLAPGGSYNKIAEAAFGKKARRPFTLLVQFQLVAVLIGYTISMGDNLARLFPHTAIHVFTVQIPPFKVLLGAAFLVILPTLWLRNLTSLSYLSLCGIFSYMIITVIMIYAGVGLDIGFGHTIPMLRPGNLLNVTGIYAYCCAAHCILPSIYTSLKDPSSYGKVLLASFSITTAFYTGFAILGAAMFGESTLPQVSLNLPAHLVSAKLVLWLVVLLPFTKYSLCLAPVALDLESKFPWPSSSRTFQISSILLRTSLMVLIFAVAMSFPYFKTMMVFTGSASGMLLAVILPSIFYLKLHGNMIPKWEAAVNYSIVVIGFSVGLSGTVESVIDFIHRRNKVAKLH